MRPINSLQVIDAISPEGRYTPGLVPVNQEDLSRLSIDEQVALNEARQFKNVDFVFFRRFSDGRSSQVAAFIVDNQDHKKSESDLIELHHDVWLTGSIPLLYIAWASRIDILTCARGPDFWKTQSGTKRYSPVKVFNIEAIEDARNISNELGNYSVLRLSDGTFWEDPSNRDLANHDNGAHQLLIQAVIEADDVIGGSSNQVSRRLLLLMILIKYLEDRKVFPNGWFSRYRKGANGFFDVLQGAEPDDVIRLLEFL